MSGNSKDNWEFYTRRVEDKAATILLDMGLAGSAPRPEFPVLGHVGVSLRAPDLYGLPAAQEYESLGAMEDALVAAVAGEGRALYAGRCIRDGEADFFFYLPALSGFGDRVEKSMAAFADYVWHSGSTADPDWEVYLNFLYPGAYDILGIQNRRALTRLEQMGDDPRLPRLVEHWIDCPARDEAEAALRGFREHGFSGESLCPTPDGPLPGHGQKPGGSHGPWAFALRLTRRDTLEDIDDLVFLLADLASEQGCVYRGWACAATSADQDGSLP